MQCKSIFLTFKMSDVCYPSLHLFSVNARRSLKNYIDRNPYDVLGLKSTCSTQDVKKAYIKLCKELHPDVKPGDASQHKKFVELNKAYSILVNVESKRHLDDKFSGGKSSHKDLNWEYKKASGSFYWDTKEKDKWEEYQQYYRNQKKNSNLPNRFKNSSILVGCFILVIIGSCLYLSAYSYATNYTLHTVDERSKRISETYKDTRSNILVTGKEEQIEKLKKRWNV